MNNIYYKGEIWKNIEGYENYMVSNFGRVKSLKNDKTKKEKILIPIKNNSGYLMVYLANNVNNRKYLIHRLVAQAFISNSNNYLYVNHKNENKTDNRVENLEWCSSRYNINYGTRNKKASISMINGKLSKKIYQYSIDGIFIKEYPSAREAERQTGFRQSNISKCCNGGCKKAYGYKWYYA